MLEVSRLGEQLKESVKGSVSISEDQATGPIALSHYLEPLHRFLSDPGISEISLNQPYGVFIEKKGDIFFVEDLNLTLFWLKGLAGLVAKYSEQRLSDKEPLLSARLPQGHRIQIVLPPACEAGTVVLSIRKQVVRNLSLSDYEKAGAFDQVRPHSIKSHRSNIPINEENQWLAELYSQGKYFEFLQKAITDKKNILISGGTGTGKTILLNACLKEVPLWERIITLEDVREVDIPHANKVHLLASKGEQGTAKISMSHLVEVCLRLRPDRIIMGEMRGAEAADFINATSTGHDGSIASIHASNPSMAFMRLVHMVKLNQNMNLSREDILEDLHSIIDVVVQVKRTKENGQYKRYISEIYSAFNPLANR